MFAVASLAAYSQVSIPKNSSKGTIVTQDNTTIEYQNLRYEKGKVTYKNTQTGIEEFLYDNSVKSIQEIPQVEKSVYVENTVTSSVIFTTKAEEKLTSIKDIKNYLKQNSSQYRSGRTLSDVGTGFIIGGGAAFIIGGASNLSKANEVNTTGNAKEGSSTPLIIGLVAAGAGVVMKIAGHAQMKNAIKSYQNADNRNFSPSYYVINNGNGVGMKMEF